MGDLIRQVSSFFGLTSNEDSSTISARAVSVEHEELPPPASPQSSTASLLSAADKVEADELLTARNSLAEARTEAQCLNAALADADAALVRTVAEMEQVEQDWTEKVNAFMQKNGELRVHLKAAQRERATAEGERDAARKRIAELEQALTEVALDSGAGDDLPARRNTSPTPAVGTVESLGDGHGGIDLGGGGIDLGGAGFAPPDAKPNGVVLDVDNIVTASAPAGEAAPTQPPTNAAGVNKSLESTWTSPPKLSLNEGSSSHESAMGETAPKGKGCCAIM